MENNYYVFNGQNATTGTANKNTGEMSFYGEVLTFSSKKTALEYVEDNATGMASDICKAGTKSTMRKYCLGMSVRDFEEYLLHTYYTCKNEYGIWE